MLRKKISSLKISIALLISFFSTLHATTLSDTCRQATWVTNGEVRAIYPAGDKVYIGGNFTQVGPYTGGAAPINTLTGLVSAVFPKVNGTLSTVVADGNGGWYIGGRFSKVDGVSRNNIAHVLSNGKVDPTWNPNASDEVNSIAVNGATVYAGGFFTSIGGQSRNKIAALDAATGLATSWNPNSSGPLLSLAVNGATVYAGGYFGNIGGQRRTGINRCPIDR